MKIPFAPPPVWPAASAAEMSRFSNWIAFFHAALAAVCPEELPTRRLAAGWLVELHRGQPPVAVFHAAVETLLRLGGQWTPMLSSLLRDFGTDALGGVAGVNPVSVAVDALNLEAIGPFDARQRALIRAAGCPAPEPGGLRLTCIHCDGPSGDVFVCGKCEQAGLS